MPPRYDRIPEITQVPQDQAAFVEVVNIAIRAMNEVLNELATSDSQFRGNDGYTPTFNADVDMAKSRLRNISRSQRGGDAVTRRELEEIGILGSADGVVFNQPVQFAAGASSSPSASGGGELANAEELTDVIEGLIAGSIAVVVSGESVNLQTYGSQGTTQGSLLFAVREDGRADALRMIDGKLAVTDRCANFLLMQILLELRRLNHVDD